MENQLSQEEIIKLAVNEGVKAARRQFKLEEEEARAKQKNRRLHNTKLLIENYRTFKVHAEKSVFTAAECEDSVVDILSMMSDQSFARAENTVASIRKSAVKTVIMVRHIEAMVDTYRVLCERSGEERKYRVIYELYIADEAKTIEEIAKKEYVDKSTIYRDIQTAIDALSSLIFGVSTIN